MKSKLRVILEPSSNSQNQQSLSSSRLPYKSQSNWSQIFKSFISSSKQPRASAPRITKKPTFVRSRTNAKLFTQHSPVNKKVQNLNSEDDFSKKLEELRKNILHCLLEEKFISRKKLKLSKKFLALYPSMKFFAENPQTKTLIKEIEQNFTSKSTFSPHSRSSFQKNKTFSSFSAQANAILPSLEPSKTQNLPFKNFMPLKGYLQTSSTLSVEPTSLGKRTFTHLKQNSDNNRPKNLAKGLTSTAKCQTPKNNENEGEIFTIDFSNGKTKKTIPINKRIRFVCHESEDLKHYAVKAKKVKGNIVGQKESKGKIIEENEEWDTKSVSSFHNPFSLYLSIQFLW